MEAFVFSQIAAWALATTKHISNANIINVPNFLKKKNAQNKNSLSS